MGDSFIALDANTLKVKSAYQIPDPTNDSDFGASPIVVSAPAGRFVVAPNKNGNVYIMKINGDGSLGLYQKIQIAYGGKDPEYGQGSISSCTYSGNILFCAGGMTFINGSPANGSIRAIDLNTFKFLWEHPTEGWVEGALAYANGMVIDNSGGILEVLDAQNGIPLYTYRVNGALVGGPSISNGAIYFGSYDHNVYALELINPSQPVYTPIPSPLPTPTLSLVNTCQQQNGICIPMSIYKSEGSSICAKRIITNDCTPFQSYCCINPVTDTNTLNE